MNEFLSGMAAALCLVAGLFFLRFWRKTRDRFFAFFAAAFWLMALHRVVMLFLRDNNEHLVAAYSIRLLAFVLILVAIVDKNRVRPRK
jgi:drug/metabolite transporter superfamily protein YnfA